MSRFQLLGRAGLVAVALAGVMTSGAQAKEADKTTAKTPTAQAAVVGGTRGKAENFPYLVDEDICGGALISPTRVLTAAHCIGDLEVGGVVKIGPAPDVRHIIHVAQHPKLTAQTEGGANPDDILPYDVAVLELDQPVTDVAPIRMATPADAASYAPGTAVTTVGRGSRDFQGNGTGTLRFASVQVASDASCVSRLNKLDHGDSFDAPTMVCTIDPDGAKPFRSGCYGDSGTPLVSRAADGSLVTVGVDDWGVACGTMDGDPENYVEVAAISDWAGNPATVWRPYTTGRPALTGTVKHGNTVTCNPPKFTDQPTKLRYRFYLDGETVSERTRQTYKLPRSARGEYVSCSVVAISDGGYLFSKDSSVRKAK